MKVRFYGRLGECIGRETDVDISGDCTVAELRRNLAAAFPQAADELARPALRACVDDVVVGENFVVAHGRAVEFFPPLSGG